MSTTIPKPEEVFTLDILASQLVGFEPPQGPHDPAGDWQLAYRVYSLGATHGMYGSLGRVFLTRQRRGDGLFSLQVKCEKPASGQFVAKLTAQIDARPERLPMPVRWSWQSEIVDRDGKRVEGTGLERSASATETEIIFGNPARKRPRPKACTLNWLLMEAVGRLPREAFDPLQFTLIDDFDQFKPGGMLSYGQSGPVVLGDRPTRQTHIEELPKGRIHKTTSAMAGGRAVRLHAYHQVGEGTVPWVYWVDDQGRLLMAVSGVEAYVLEQETKP